MEVEKNNNGASNTTKGKPIICKAAVCRKAGEALIIEDIEVAPPQAWEVRIKILCTSLCHTDVTFWKLDLGPASSLPRIFGHEAVGVVESVGDFVEEVKEGDRVLPVFFPDCGECRDCTSSKSNVCTKFVNTHYNAMPRDGTRRFKDMNGEPIHHFISVSSFTEYTVVDVINVVKISPQIPLDKACLLGCGVTTGVGAVSKVAQVEEGSTVAIFGLGAVGLSVAQASKQQGASKIIGVDLNPEKEDTGKKFGVTDYINPKDYGEKKISEVIKELTNGGVDYAFECIGLASVMEDAFESTREGWGKTIILGVEIQGAPLNLSTISILRGKSVMGSLFGGIKPKSDIPLLAQKYIEKQYSLPIDEKSVESKPVEAAKEEAASEKTEEAPAAPAVDSSEAPTDAAETTLDESAPAAEESSNVPDQEESASEEASEETPEIKLETAPADFRFPTTNQTRHCFTRYIEYHRCVAAKGEDAPECDKFQKFYRSLCPGEWVDRWNEQRENGTFPGPL